MLNVILLIVIMLNVIILNVVAPGSLPNGPFPHKSKNIRLAVTNTLAYYTTAAMTTE
jgi:hypothetical protein